MAKPIESTGSGRFEAKLWQTVDALRNNMDAAEHKHGVLGLIFLKYISDAFEAKHAELEADRAAGADPEDPDEYGRCWLAGSRVTSSTAPLAICTMGRFRMPMQSGPYTFQGDLD